MKKTILLFAGLAISNFLHSQSTFSIIKPIVEMEKPVGGEFDLAILNAGVKNNTDKEIDLAFKQTKADYPEGWIHSFCGPENCYTPPISKQGVDKLAADGKEKLLEVNVSYPTPGVGVIEYEVYDKAKPNDKQIVKFKLTAVITSIERSLAAQTKLFPNPAKGNVTLKLPNNSFTEISLSDLTGKVLLTQSASEVQDINLSGINSGMYVLTVKGN
ncbi:MAG: T9SS C-terminal target domain-containing protein, partial [Cytophagales bacterium]